jgi:CubicO group peptidase (beta-lactamase class C family)
VSARGRARLLAAVQADRPLFAPDTDWRYSNVGYRFVRELIEAATGSGLDDALAAQVTRRLGLSSVRVAPPGPGFPPPVGPGGAGAYDPGWVYHGCLFGTAGDAARLLDAMFAGRLLGPESLGAMTARYPLGGALPGRPWTRTGYGLGLMSGEMGATGRALGHSGAGPSASPPSTGFRISCRRSRSPHSPAGPTKAWPNGRPWMSP